MEIMTAAIGVMIIGLVLLIVEALFPGGYILIPGFVMVIIGGFGQICPDSFYTWWTPLIAIIAIIPSTAFTLWVYKYLGSPEPPTTTVATSLIGKTGTVVIDIVPETLKGKVKIGSDTWSADAKEPIPKGSTVVVDHSEGVHVFVSKK